MTAQKEAASAELNWLKYRELKERDAEWDSEVRPVEDALRAEIRTSVQALGAVLIIQIHEGDEKCEEVPDLWRASLSAIRPQLVGAIGEDADRMLGQTEAAPNANSTKPDPIFGLIEAYRPAWASAVDADFSEDLALERNERHAKADEILNKLLETAPTTLAGARAVIAFLVDMDAANVPEKSGGYLPTLLQSPIFAGIDDEDTARALAEYERQQV